MIIKTVPQKHLGELLAHVGVVRIKSEHVFLCRQNVNRSPCLVLQMSKVSAKRTSTVFIPSFGNISKCLATATASRVEYGYAMMPCSTSSRSSANARHKRRRTSMDTVGAYARRSSSSESSSGLSIALQSTSTHIMESVRTRPIASSGLTKERTHWLAKMSPISRKKLLPRNGKPGRFANTHIWKLGCNGITSSFSYSSTATLVGSTRRLPLPYNDESVRRSSHICHTDHFCTNQQHLAVLNETLQHTNHLQWRFICLINHQRSPGLGRTNERRVFPHDSPINQRRDDRQRLNSRLTHNHQNQHLLLDNSSCTQLNVHHDAAGCTRVPVAAAGASDRRPCSSRRLGFRSAAGAFGQTQCLAACPSWLQCAWGCRRNAVAGRAQGWLPFEQGMRHRQCAATPSLRESALNIIEHLRRHICVQQADREMYRYDEVEHLLESPELTNTRARRTRRAESPPNAHKKPGEIA